MVRHPRDGDTNEGGSADDRPGRRPAGGAGARPAGRTGGGAGGLPADADLHRFTASSRTREAVRARSREHWLRRQVLEATTLAGACRSLAEAGQPLSLTTVGGRSHHGWIRSLGDDFVSLVVAGGRELVLPLAGLAALEPGRGDGPTGRPPSAAGTTFAEAVAQLAADRPPVTVWCLGGTAPVVGELLGASAELALLGPRPGERRTVVYVRLSAVVELSVNASG